MKPRPAVMALVAVTVAEIIKGKDWRSRPASSLLVRHLADEVEVPRIQVATDQDTGGGGADPEVSDVTDARGSNDRRRACCFARRGSSSRTMRTHRQVSSRPSCLPILVAVSVDLATAGAAIAASNMWKLSRLGQVLEATERARVPVIVLKGAALLDWLFALEERPMADVDLFIRPEDRGRFLDALAPDGRVVTASTNRGLLAGYDAGQFSVDFRGLPLDVHVHLLDSPWLRRLAPIDEAALWMRAVPTTIAGRRSLRLSPEDQLLHFAAHVTFHHADWPADNPHRVEDSRRLIERTPIDWRLLCDLANKQKIRTAAWLLLASPALSELVPDQVLRELRPTAVGLRRADLARRAARSGERSLAPVLLTDTTTGMLRAAVMILIPSREWLRSNYATTPTTPARTLRHLLTVSSSAVGRIARIAKRSAAPPQPAGSRARLSALAKASLALRIWFWFFVVHLDLRTHSLPTIVARLREAPKAHRAAIAPVRLGHIVVRVLRLGEHRPRCLINALVHYRLLAEQGVQGELVVGLLHESSNQEAHAWIELDGRDVGPPPGRGHHVALARY